MTWLRNMPIRGKVTLVILLASITALLAACTAFVRYEMLASRRALSRDLTALADVIGRNSVVALKFDDSSAAANILQALQTERFDPTDLNKIIEQAVQVTEPKWKRQAQAAGVDIQVRCELRAVAPVAAEESELREALTNLISNAVDAMPKGGTITIRTRTEDSRAIIEITDTGTGMPEEVRAHCFEPFFSTKGDSGTGLGLAIVFGIIQRHHGSIEVQSRRGGAPHSRSVYRCILTGNCGPSNRKQSCRRTMGSGCWWSKMSPWFARSKPNTWPRTGFRWKPLPTVLKGSRSFAEPNSIWCWLIVRCRR